MWRVYLIKNFEQGCAVYARFHHCIADGIALIQVMLSLTDERAEPEIEQIDVMEIPAATQNGHSGLLRRTAHKTTVLTQRATALTSLMLAETLKTVRDPGRGLAFAKSAGILSAATAAVLARFLIIPADRPSVLRGELGTAKSIAWSEPVPLDKVKEIGRATGGTVNDVLIAALTGALRKHMADRGDDVSQGDLRAMVPVNLRDPQASLNLGNRFGLVYLSLPVAIADPLRRLYEVKRRMDNLKSSPEAVVAYQLLALLGSLPGELAEHFVSIFASKASIVLTNVPGPRRKLYFAGRPIRRMMFWVPQAGDIGIGISIISYAGEVSLGLMVDEKLVDDPTTILRDFEHEFDVLGSNRLSARTGRYTRIAAVKEF